MRIPTDSFEEMDSRNKWILELFLKSLSLLSLKQDDVQKLDRQIVAQRAEIERIDRMAFTLYESLQNGILSEADYLGYKARYNTMRDEAELAVNNLSREVEGLLACSGKIKFAGCVPFESAWDEKFEQSRVENGFKWSPVKSYYRKISNKGIQSGEGWKIRIDMNPRNGLTVPAQEFVLIVTIKDPTGHDIYSEVVNGLRSRGYVTNNLETRQQIRQRQ